MPFQSKAQQREMFANQPEIAKRWAGETHDFKDLPEHVGEKMKKRPSAYAAALARHRQRSE